MDKNKIMMIAIIGLLVVLLLGIAVVAFLIIRLSNRDDLVPENYNTIVDPRSIELIRLQPISANLNRGESNRNSSIRLEVSIGINMDDRDSEEFMQIITTKEDVILDLITSILRSKTFEQISAINAQELLADEILTGLKDIFQTQLITGVYFPVFFTT